MDWSSFTRYPNWVPVEFSLLYFYLRWTRWGLATCDNLSSLHCLLFDWENCQFAPVFGLSCLLLARCCELPSAEQNHPVLSMLWPVWFSEWSPLWPYSYNFVDRIAVVITMRMSLYLYPSLLPMGFLPDTKIGGLRMHRECRERFPRHRGLAIPTCITASAWPTIMPMSTGPFPAL